MRQTGYHYYGARYYNPQISNWLSVDQFYGGDIMGGNGQPPCGGAAGNRCGHNVTDNDEFIKKGEQ